MKRLIEQTPDIIIISAWERIEVVRNYAILYPEIYFILNDKPLTGLPNVISTVYGQHEGSFLVGALAGWMTKTKKVAFIGGVDTKVIHAFRIGFREGVHYADPKVEVAEAYVSRGRDFSGFQNPAEGHRLALEQYKNGVDIIYAAAGLSGNGVILAAQQEKKFVIGVDTNQDHLAKGFVLTSMVKRLDHAIFQEISNIIKGSVKAGVHFYGLKQGGISLTPMKHTKHLVPGQILQSIKETEAKIITGEIKVTNFLYER